MRATSSAFLVAFLLVGSGCVGSDYSASSDPNKQDGTSPGPGEAPLPDAIEGSPKDSELTEELGIFVARSSSADADGTRAKPLPTIAAGIQRAKEVGKRVYVCAETFEEAVTIERGIPMIGGLDCSTPIWSKKRDALTKVAAPSSPALRATNIDIPTRVEGFEILAPDGTATAPSSIGLIATQSPGLMIVGGKIQSGRGADGASGTEGMQLTFSSVAAAGAGIGDWLESDRVFVPGVGQSPKPRPAKVGGAGGRGTCVGAAGVSGGTGGTGGLSTDNYADYCGGPFCVSPPPLIWRQVQSAPPVTPGAAGLGQPAKDGTDGASAVAPGRLSPEGFTPADGLAGSSGTPGQGGAGGGGASYPNRNPTYDDEFGQGATGSGGGAGGCPGLAGTPGMGGAASIAALVSASGGLTFDGVALIAGAGGKGGRGTLGSSATAGGAAGTTTAGASAATKGQAGGRAGVSGSGAGGSSIGLAHQGPAPALANGASAKAGVAGLGVAGEQDVDDVGNTRTLAPSVGGESKDVLAF